MESELRDGYKMTELGALPEEWEVKNLSNLLLLIKNGTTETQVQKKTDYPVTRIETISDWTINYDKVGYINSNKIAEQFKLFKYDILLSHINSIKHIGKVALYLEERPLYHGMNLMLLRPNLSSGINPIFLYIYLTTYYCKNYFEAMAKPAINQASLSQKEITNLLVPLPPLPEQRRIATILSTLDETVEHTEALIEKYDNIKAGLMADLLTRGIDEEGKIRSEDTHRFKDSALGRVPEEWEITFLGNCCKKITDGSHFSPVPTKDGPKIANVKDIFGKNINIKSCTSISNEDFIKLEKGGCSPNRGDVLLSKDGTIGKTLVYEQNEKIVLLSSIAIIKPKDNLNSYFLHNILKSFYFDKQMLILISGSALRRVVLRDINLIQIPLPSLKEQRRIAEILTSADQRIEKEEAYRDKLLQLKKGLMQDLLTGKVRVSSVSK